MMTKLLEELNRAFTSATIKQMEAYARYLHNLSAVCVVGAATVYYPSAYTVWDVVKLAAAGVVFFLGGALLIKGE
jgi:hypothetical protein